MTRETPLTDAGHSLDLVMSEARAIAELAPRFLADIAEREGSKTGDLSPMGASLLVRELDEIVRSYEGLRLQAVLLAIETGRLTPTRAAEALGMSRAGVNKWLKLAREGDLALTERIRKQYAENLRGPRH